MQQWVLTHYRIEKVGWPNSSLRHAANSRRGVKEGDREQGNDLRKMWDGKEKGVWCCKIGKLFAFQYSWHVMQDVPGLVAAMGGRERFVERLDALFTARPQGPDTKGDTVLLDISGMIGQYVHGNEPSHHVIYFYPQVGHPEKAAERIREVIDTQYHTGPTGLCGNDDCGQMSAWYVFSAMGFYPFNPCGGEYVIGAPQVPKATLKLANGKTFTMTAKGLSKENKYVKSVTLNGKAITDWKIRHEDIVKGGELVFEMSDAVSRPVTLETATLKVEFDPTTGSLVQVGERESGAPIFSAKDGALWEAEFDGGPKLTERTLIKNGGRVDFRPTAGGLNITWSDTNLTLRFEVRAIGDEIELRPVVVNTARTMRHLFYPFNLLFDPKAVSRVVVPGNPHRGFGLSLHPEVFMPQSNAAPDKTYLCISDCYANSHSDFVFMDRCEGTSLMFYGVQARPAHEPWACSNPFVRTHWIAHAVGGEKPTGRVVHGCWPYVRTKDTPRALPAVRFTTAKDLQAGLDAYAEANDLGKPLREKAPAAILDKMLHGPLLYLDGSAKEMMSSLDKIPAPSMIHTADYVHGGFDHQYPDFLPCNPKWGTDAELKQLIDVCHKFGHTFFPYTNPTWWCDEPRGPTFQAAGEDPLYVKGDGKHRFEDYNGAKGWTICFWHPAVRAANRKTVHQFTKEFPCDLLFQDQIGGRMETDDFNPAAPHPTAYTEGLLSMVEEDCRDVALGCEDGWDKVANLETAMYGNCWRMVPWSLNPPKHQNLYKTELPPHLWEYEAVFPRLMKGEVLFYMHDLGQFVWDDRILAWMVAFAINTSYRTPYRTFLSDTPQSRWYRHLCDVQKNVISKLAAQPVVSFVHDRKPLLARTDIPHDSPLDDGIVIAQYGQTKVYVNLGNVSRTVGGHALGPYGWKVEGR